MEADKVSPVTASDPDAACARAMQLQLGGELDAARQAYLGILQSAPRHAAANYCLGMLCVQTRTPANALPFLQAAIDAAPAVNDYWLGYLEALILVRRTTAAKQVLALGVQQGIAGPAVDELARRLEAAAADADLQGRNQEAGLLQLVNQQRNAEACDLARRMTGQFPERGLAWKILGALSWAARRTADALAALEQAVKLLPQDVEAHRNLGLAFFELERFAEANIYLQSATAIAPDSPHAHYSLALAYSHQGRVAEADASYRRGMALRPKCTEPEDAKTYSNLLFNMAHNPDVTAARLFAEHVAFGARFEGSPRGALQPHGNDRNPERRLKVGFVSGDLNGHPVGQFLEPVIARLAGRPGLELHAYCTHPTRDAVSERLLLLFKSWNPVDGLADAAMVATVRDDRIDVLIDLSGHTWYNRLPVFARKPAPLQVSWLGYPGTTGLKSMDYYFADRRWLPPGRMDGLFTEKLVYLPDRWAYQLHAAAAPVNLLPALEAGYVTFGSFHRLGKINAATIQLWSEVLLGVPDAKLLLAGIPLTGSDQRIREQFAAQGVAPERLIFHARCLMDGYFALHHEVDIGLDTVAYAGGTTTMHSLAMGVPTLTIAGATAQARAGAGILANIGLDEFIATDAADFIEKACYWAAHLTELAALRATLRTRLLHSPAGQPDLIATHFEIALRHMWRRWCAGKPAKSFATEHCE